MKRIFQHPPEPLTGKKYWRSLSEYSNTPEFREWLEREFPAQLSERFFSFVSKIPQPIRGQENATLLVIPRIID